MRRPRAVVLLAAAILSMHLAACKRGRASVGQEVERTPVVRDDSDGLLLTWIDDKGNFHVETRAADVPMMGREPVRVADPHQDDGSRRDSLFVADLRQLRADGSYPVRTMTRADFEAIAVARREKAGPTLASAAPPSPSPRAAADPTETSRVASRAVVIVYGAEWCGACHEAMHYLRQKGVAYVEKDVEKDPSAAREMQQKLARSGLQTGSIPIIDVRGKVMVGFNPAAIDAALGQAL